ncbi:MAG: cupredoxin domain-containing protein [Bdellovibrionales bacterium]|nr:cupredoxin domain-containing protein [Bdellovibrionales bacterium]
MKVAIFSLILTTMPLVAMAAPNEYKMTVTEKGYEPGTLKIKANTPAVLKITRMTNATCAREITVPSQKLKVDLPMNKEVTVKLAGLHKGEIKFGCAMDMMIGGVIIAE